MSHERSELPTKSALLSRSPTGFPPGRKGRHFPRPEAQGWPEPGPHQGFPASWPPQSWPENGNRAIDMAEPRWVWELPGE